MKIFVGNDLVFLPRFAQALSKDHFKEKMFHPIELDYCHKKLSQRDALSSFAVRFAAKEAFLKALGIGLYGENSMGPKDVWIENDPRGKPLLQFSDKLTNYLDTNKIKDWDVSLSHHGDYAYASVVLQKET